MFLAATLFGRTEDFVICLGLRKLGSVKRKGVSKKKKKTKFGVIFVQR